MKKVKAIGLSSDRLAKNWKYTFFCILLIGVLTILINIVLINYESITYVKRCVSKFVKTDVDKTYIIDFDIQEVKSEDLSLLPEELNKDLECELYGNYIYASTKINEFKGKKEFQNINKKVYDESVLNPENRISFDVVKNYTNILCIGENLGRMCDLKYEFGESCFNFQSEDNLIPVVVGYNYKDILKVGDMFTSAVYEEKYQVVGVLKQGESWLAADSLGSNIEFSKCLDNYIIVSRGDILTHNYGNLYYFVSNYDKELVIKKTKAMLNKMGYSVNVYTLEEQLNESLKEEFELIRTYVVVLIFLSSIGVVTLSSISVNSVIDEMKNIGIMYSIGFTYKDMRNITISENVLKILVGSVVGFAISYSYIYSNSLSYEKDIINEIEFSTMPLIILAIMIVITMLSVVIPLRYVKKIDIRELVTK